MKTVITFLADEEDLEMIERESEYILRRNPNLVKVTRTLAIQTLLSRGDLERVE